MPDKGLTLGSKWHYTVGRVMLFYLSSVVVFAFTSMVAKAVAPEIANHVSMLLANVLSVGLVILFARWEKIGLSNTGIMPGNKTLPRFLAGFAAGLSMAIVQVLIVMSFGHFALIRSPQVNSPEIFSALLLYLLAASREEVVFRSYMLRSLNYSLSSGVAITIMTLLFVAEHIVAGQNLGVAILGNGLGGLLFGLAALKTKGLALPLGLHAAWNFGQWAFGFKDQSGMWQVMIDKGYDEQVQRVGLTAFAIVMIVAIGAVIAFTKKPVVPAC